jgi:hypothetical protein
MARVCPKRDRLPSSLLIENASALELPCAPASCSEAFPIKASDFSLIWIASGWPNAQERPNYGSGTTALTETVDFNLEK